MDFHLALALVAFLVVISGLLVIKLQSVNLTQPLIAMAAGLLVGPYVLDVVYMQSWQDPEHFMKLASEFTISMALMATAYRLDAGYLQRFARTQAVILGLVMPLMWLLSGLIAHLALGMSWGLALLLGAVITPTDPVVSATIVSGKTAEKLLPARIRDTISFESGANDGLAFPLVGLMLFILGYTSSDHLSGWFVRVVLWETLAAISIGLLSGYVFGRLMHMAHQKGWMNPKALLSFTIAFALMVLGFVEVIHANGIIAVFAGALILHRTLSNNEVLKEEKVQEMMERIFTVPVYFFLGIFLPVEAWLKAGWPLLVFGVLIMLFRRIPAFVLLRPLFRQCKSWPDLLLLGWFGPVGVAAIFYAMHVLEETPYRQVWVMGSFIIFLSTLVHGVSSLPFSKLYARFAAE